LFGSAKLQVYFYNTKHKYKKKSLSSKISPKPLKIKYLQNVKNIATEKLMTIKPLKTPKTIYSPKNIIDKKLN
jgi:hypothetical protein